jgi:transcription initiation factor TFIID subunit 5
VVCAEISDDSSSLAVGFTNSQIKVWSLVPQKLRAMKSAEKLQDIDYEAGYLFVLNQGVGLVIFIMHYHNIDCF